MLERELQGVSPVDGKSIAQATFLYKGRIIPSKECESEAR